jgi:hypothetical protein
MEGGQIHTGEEQQGVIAETVKVIDLSGQRRKHEQVNTK